MQAITLDEVQCDIRSLGRWASDLEGRPFWKTFFQFFAIADRALEVAQSTKACMFSCPKIETELGCLPETVRSGASIAKSLRLMAKATFLVRFLVGNRFSRAAEAWEGVVEDAEDIISVLEAEKDTSPPIPWEQVKAELGL